MNQFVLPTVTKEVPIPNQRFQLSFHRNFIFGIKKLGSGPCNPHLSNLSNATLTEACPRHAWQEVLWKKSPLRTSTCGRHRFRRNYPLWEPRMWQGRVWDARPDGEATRGKAKFGKRHGSRKWEEENSSTRRRHRGKGGNGRKLPPPVGHPQGGLLSITLYFSNAGNASAAIFLGFWSPQWSFARVLPRPQGIRAFAGIRACVGRYVNQNGCFSGPCLATLLPSRNRKGLKPLILI